MKLFIFLGSLCTGRGITNRPVGVGKLNEPKNEPNEEIEPFGPDSDDDLFVGGSQNRNIQNDLTYRWPNKLINIDLSPKVAPNVVGSMHQAFKELKLKADINFKGILILNSFRSYFQFRITLSFTSLTDVTELEFVTETVTSNT